MENIPNNIFLGPYYFFLEFRRLKWPENILQSSFLVGVLTETWKCPTIIVTFFLSSDAFMPSTHLLKHLGRRYRRASGFSSWEERAKFCKPPKGPLTFFDAVGQKLWHPLNTYQKLSKNFEVTSLSKNVNTIFLWYAPPFAKPRKVQKSLILSIFRIPSRISQKINISKILVIPRFQNPKTSSHFSTSEFPM